ncbi:MAG: exosortase-associated EpsI family protein [Sedimentisphaerales bacterium]|nr:exosortase-associated EpsI family protein [Sedimentisphaerales bacterium]
MLSETPKNGPVIAAIIAADILLLAFGFLYNSLASRLGQSNPVIPIDQEIVNQLPLEIGDWTGQDVPLDAIIIRATGTDAHLYRRYSRHQGLESVLLYIACGVSARSLAAHRPEVCYVAAGQTLINRRSTELPLSTGLMLPCSVFDFSHGGLSTDQTIVLDYFIVDGRYCGDYSLLASRAWRGSDTIAYATQVQVVASSTGTLTADSATKIIYNFAVDSAAAIAGLFERIQEDKFLDSHDEINEGGSF